MSTYKENLEGVVSRLKEQGVQAGESEKKKIIEAARQEADQILAEAKTKGQKIIDEAKSNADQSEKNAKAAITQAARDLIEATKISLIDHLKDAFGNECKQLFAQEEYLKVLLEKVLEQISGKKSVEVPSELASKMGAYISKSAFANEVTVKPLTGSDAKIVIKCDDNDGMQFMVSAEDVQQGLFSLVNSELVEKITGNKEA
jgi:V/A-type H+-transporting ATPase subunit E